MGRAILYCKKLSTHIKNKYKSTYTSCGSTLIIYTINLCKWYFKVLSCLVMGWISGVTAIYYEVFAHLICFTRRQSSCNLRKSILGLIHLKQIRFIIKYFWQPASLTRFYLQDLNLSWGMSKQLMWMFCYWSPSEHRLYEASLFSILYFILDLHMKAGLTQKPSTEEHQWQTGFFCSLTKWNQCIIAAPCASNYTAQVCRFMPDCLLSVLGQSAGVSAHTAWHCVCRMESFSVYIVCVFVCVYVWEGYR